MSKIIIGLIVTLSAATALAESEVRSDVLLLERVAKSDDRKQPRRGITMRSVEAEFGEPNSKTAAVGSPPISRWHYDDFTVYFESEWVIDSVINSLTETEQLVRAQ